MWGVLVKNSTTLTVVSDNRLIRVGQYRPTLRTHSVVRVAMIIYCLSVRLEAVVCFKYACTASTKTLLLLPSGEFQPISNDGSYTFDSRKCGSSMRYY